MPIEFDPATSTYYTTAYSGAAVQQTPTEPPPEPAETAPPPEESASPPEQTEAPPITPPPEQTLAGQGGGYPGGATTGSIVDTVV